MITLLYSAHDEKELTPEIATVIRSSDIFVVEDIRYSPKSNEKERSLNDLSKGLVDLSQVDLEGSMQEEFLLKLFEILYKSGIKVHLERSNLHKEYKKADEIVIESETFFCEGRPDQAIKKYIEYCNMVTVLDNQRDENLAEFLISLQKPNREKDVSSLRGALHTPVYHMIARQGMPVRRIFPYMPYLFDLRNEISRRYNFGKTVDDLTVFQSFACVEIYGYFKEKKIFHSISDTVSHADKIARLLTEGEVRELSKHISENWWPKLGEIILNNVTGDWLEEKGYI